MPSQEYMTHAGSTTTRWSHYFLALSHLKPLWEHDLRDFLSEADLFYPFGTKWVQTAPKAGGEAELNGALLPFHLHFAQYP